jgi:hypothetical protein
MISDVLYSLHFAFKAEKVSIVSSTIIKCKFFPNYYIKQPFRSVKKELIGRWKQSKLIIPSRVATLVFPYRVTTPTIVIIL